MMQQDIRNKVARIRYRLNGKAYFPHEPKIVVDSFWRYVFLLTVFFVLGSALGLVVSLF